MNCFTKNFNENYLVNNMKYRVLAKPIVTIVLMLAVISYGPMASAKTKSDDEQKTPDMQELKKNFKERLSALTKLKDQQKVGESYNGYVATIKEDFKDDTIPVQIDKENRSDNEERPSIKEFLKRENHDRKLLYEKLAEKLDTSKEEVAKQNAIRNFKKAESSHYLRPKQSDKWIKKEKLEID